MVKVVCGDCTGLAYVGGAHVYKCLLKGEPLDQKSVEERIPIECGRFGSAPRQMAVQMKEYVEVGITTVYGNGSVQLPSEIRQALEIRDGDKILWIRKGMHEYTFRKVGYAPKIKPKFR